MRYTSTGLNLIPTEVHTLGNLLILSSRLNSKLGVKAPEEKVGDYRNTGLLIAEEVADRLHDWNFEAIKERETALLEWALQAWAD